MSVFEDLIDELRNENLLEETVIDIKRADVAARAASLSGTNNELSTGHAFVTQMGVEVQIGGAINDALVLERPSSETEYFRKRAMDEMSSLQMVEHVLSGIEREHLKSTPVSFDDLKAKKALHQFIQVSGDPRAAEYEDAELALRRETEAWGYAHYERDRKISVAKLRRFCEECRPVLSSQALIALARFYRNSPYSEDVRGKFEFVMTRLFSREAGEGNRRLLFEPNEMIGHINTLYADWSSIALYTRDDDKIEVSLTVTRFAEFKAEVEKAESFDELLNSEFFDRIRSYKEECAEMFYVPEVTAEAIKCNLAVGNCYINLIAQERHANSVQTLEEKYGSSTDNLVSAAAGRTLVLSELLELEPWKLSDEVDFTVLPAQAVVTTKPKTSKRATIYESGRSDLFGVSRWLLIVCFVCIALTVAVYIWSEKLAGGDESVASVAASVDIGDQDIMKYIRSPRATQEILYAVTEPSFGALSEAEQKELLGKIREIANSRNLSKVSLVNSSGKTVAFASKDRLELVTR